MMVAESVPVSSPTDDNVTVMQPRGDYLLTNLGVQPNKRIQSMTQAISVLVTSGKMDGSISDLKDVGLLPELLPDLPQWITTHRGIPAIRPPSPASKRVSCGI